jgi:hypothetical protein
MLNEQSFEDSYQYCGRITSMYAMRKSEVTEYLKVCQLAIRVSSRLAIG